MIDIFSLKKWAIIKLVYGCNHHCSFCHERDNIFSLEFSLIQRDDLDTIRVWLIANWFDYVIISWWECSLHPRLVEIIQFFQKDFYVVVISNGSHIDKHNFQELWNNITFYFSFHGLNDIYNSITQSKDFDNVLKNIQKVSQLWHTIILRTVVNRENIHQMNTIYEFILKNFSENVYFEAVLLEDLRYEHVEKENIGYGIYLKMLLSQIVKYKGKRILFDGWMLCSHPLLWKYGAYLADPLTNTMVWLVKKKKDSSILFDIKNQVSSNNIKSNLWKCKTCLQYTLCHWVDKNYFDTDYLWKK